MDDEFGQSSADREFVGEKANRIGALNVALLFGTAAIALSLILTPVLAPSADDDRLQASTMDYDNITTGSIPTTDGKVKRYTIRRSILQQNPAAACIIESNGDEHGGC